MQMPGPWDFFPTMGSMFFWVPVIIVMFILMMVMRFFRRGRRRRFDGVCMEAPRFAIPEKHRGQTRTDGTEIRTVRLPSQCSNCGAQLSSKDIEWTGPLEAKCNYCGSTVRAQLERI
ncbi:MAG: hypothetical protein ACFFF9_15715 [Candidatus Thorarchaeota archaeon]